MSATRSSAMRPLKQLQQARKLHMTGAATSPSRFLTSEKPFPTETTQQAKPERPTASTTTANPPQRTRNFNTTRPLPASNDSSTIDFAFLPSSALLDSADDRPAWYRVPILPTNFSPPRDIVHVGGVVEIDPPVHRPIVSTVSAESDHVQSASAVSAVGSGIGALVDEVSRVDFQGVVEKVEEAARGVVGGEGGEVVKKAQGMVREVWKGLMDDVFGEKGGKPGKA